MSPLSPAQENGVFPPAVTAPEPPSDDSELERLLDLADAAPERLPSIDVREAAPQRTASPETFFDPDLATNAPATTTGGLLTQAPGVIVRSTSVLNQDIRIRGYSGSQVVGVADGVNQIKTRLDIDALFSQIDPSLIDSVSVISGPYSVEYGPGFSFLDARLISPTRTDILSITSHSTVGFNTNGQQLVWRETLGYSNVSSGAIVSFGQRMGNDYSPGANSRDYDVPASYHVQDVYAALSSDVTELGRLDIRFLHQGLHDTELPGVAYDINHQHAEQVNFRWSVRDEFTEDERFVTQFWWNQAVFDGDSSRAAKHRTFSDRLMAEPDPDLLGGVLIGNGLAEGWGARAVSIWGDLDFWQVRAGLDWRRTRQFYRESNFEANGDMAFDGDVFGLPDSTTDDFGAFVGGSFSLTDRWQIGVGQRIDAVGYSVQANDIVATTTEYSPVDGFQPGFDTDVRWLTTTYLTSSFQANEVLTLSAGVGYAMRPPNLTELYSDQPFAPLVRFGNSFALGDSELDPERNLQFDVGFTVKDEETTFGARAFHSTINDYIGLAANNYSTFPEVGVAPPGVLGRGRPYMPDPGIPNQDLNADSASIGYSYRNISRATLYGFDIWGEHALQPWLEVVGSVAYTHGINHDPTWVDVFTGNVTPLSDSEGLPGIYPLSGTLGLRLVEPEDRRWTLEWQTRMAADQNVLAYSLGEVGTPGFAVHNIHAFYRWNDYVSIRTSILNVLDRNYFEHNSLAIVDRDGNIGFVKNPGFSWFVGVDAKF
ncbi:MAG: TonB-dependent receptor [Pirellulales bacterium]